MTSSDATLAGGLLWWLDAETATEDELLDALRQVASPSLLWTRLGGGAPVPPLRERSDDPHLPLWRHTPTLSAAAQTRLAGAWRQLAGDAGGPLEAVRVEVDEVADAETLIALAGVTGGPVSPILGQGGLRFAWRWPLRVGVIGDHAAVWADEINHHRHAGEQFAAHEVTGAAGPEAREVLLLDAAVFDAHDDPRWDAVPAATSAASAVIVIGDEPAASLLARVRGMPRIIAAVAEPGVSWWGPVYDELAHDLPLDVALRRVLPGRSLIGGIGRVLDLTAVAHWGLEVVRREPALADLRHLIQSTTFDAESQGARAVTHWAGTVADDLTISERHGEQAAMAPDDGPDEQGPLPTARRLIAAVWDGERECRRVAPPQRDLALELRVAVPVRGEVFTNRDFPDPDTDQPVADLEVEVTSSVWATPQTQPLLLPTRSAEASTSAVFEFVSPAAGPLRFDIVVRFQGRALQTATLSVPVRDRAIGRDRVRFLTTSTTAGPTPVPGATPAEIPLNALSGLLTWGARAISLVDLQAAVALIERRASQTLGADPAPANLTDEAARDLLVDLARGGVDLKQRMDNLGVPDEGTIGLLVHPDTPVLPLELVYQGERPRSTARLCRHVRTPEQDPPPPWGTPCPHATKGIVCPYAFWGLYRTIVRDVQLPPGRVRQPATLTLRPVLYAATEIADRGTPPGTTPPSERLLDAAEDLFGRTAVARVTSWTGWRRGVRAQRPQLLLLLAHRETAHGETGLFIGRRSFLPRGDVRPDVVATPETPTQPLVLLVACASAVSGSELGTLPGAFAGGGAAAVVGTLSKLSGPQGAIAGAAILRALREAADAAGQDGITLGETLGRARRALIAQGLAIGLLLVCHGDIDLRMRS